MQQLCGQLQQMLKPSRYVHRDSALTSSSSHRSFSCSSCARTSNSNHTLPETCTDSQLTASSSHHSSSCSSLVRPYNGAGPGWSARCTAGSTHTRAPTCLQQTKQKTSMSCTCAASMRQPQACLSVEWVLVGWLLGLLYSRVHSYPCANMSAT